MRPQLELAYLGLEVSDPTAVGAFLTDVVGLVPGERTAAGSATWRNDAKVHRLVMSEGPADDATVIGVEAVDEAAFTAVLDRLVATGHEPEPGDPALLAERRVAALARVATPFGLPVEVVLGLAEAGPVDPPLVPGGFLTEGMGFGHVVVATTAFDAAVAFLVDGLGLARSDRLAMELAPGIDLEVHFFHANERHHSIALARAPFELPQRLHHVMVETNERDDVGAAFDRAWASGLPIPNGLGRHDNDGMFSFYVTGPAGFQVEVGHGARRITEGWADDREYTRISAWGHQPLRSA